jgi:hypothetical protein
MATVVADMSMSLDGFVAVPNDEMNEVFSYRIQQGDRGRTKAVGTRERR